jgi:hypothetical protein
MTRTTTSLALTLGLLVSLVSLPSPALGQAPRPFRADTGIVTPGPNQILRITVATGAGNDALTLRFRRTNYLEGACGGGVCKHTVASQATSAPITLTNGEGATFDIAPGSSSAVRGLVAGNLIGTDRSVVVKAVIIDTTTGAQVDSVLIALLLP